MPLIAIALAAYVAGLYAGFAPPLWCAVAAIGAAIAVGIPRGPAVATSLGGLALAGCVVARTARANDARCLAGALHQPAMLVVVEDSVAPGGYVKGQLAGCGGSTPAWLAVVEGSAAAGSTVAARGIVVSTQRGVLVQHASIAVVRPPPRLIRWRHVAGAAIDRTFGVDAPLVRALLIADKSELSPEIRERFAAAGLAHLLAIAGLHIGIIVLVITSALEVSGLSHLRARILTTLMIVAYVVVIGAPVAAIRSATMLVTLTVTRVAQRPTSRWAIVALGASQPIAAPDVVLQVGYPLSVVGVAAMIAAARLARRLRLHRLSPISAAAAGIALATAVATIGTAPIVAWTFGRVSVAAPLTNVVAAPLIALAQPMILCGLALTPLPGLAHFVADAAHPLLLALDGLAAWAAAAPFASLVVAPTITAAAVAGVLSAATMVACASRHWQRPALIGGTAAALLVWLPALPSAPGLVELHVLDVGQGDAIALRTPHGHWALFDAGRAWRGGDAGRSTVIPYLGQHGGASHLDLFVLSHPHTDHVGGAASVLDALRPPTYVDPGFPGPAEAYRASLDMARRDHVHWARAHPGDSIVIDGVRIAFLAPDSAWTAALVDPNLASVVARVTFGDVHMLLMGDAEWPEEEWLLAHVAPGGLRAEILKVGHHGSSTSSSEAFLDAVAPQVAVVSVGTANSYHLPTPAIMHRLAAHGAQVLRTDRLGTIVARTDGHRVLIDAAGDEWELPPRSPPASPVSGVP